jgi:hypothetical protein
MDAISVLVDGVLIKFQKGTSIEDVVAFIQKQFKLEGGNIYLDGCAFTGKNLGMDASKIYHFTGASKSLLY